LRIAAKKWRHSAIISELNTTVTSSGKAPGATAKTYLTVELALTPSTWVIGTAPSDIQGATAQSSEIATGIDPGVIHPATIDGIPLSLFLRPIQFHSVQFCPAFMRLAAHDRLCGRFLPA
jgi:hypothetical protein